MPPGAAAAARIPTGQTGQTIAGVMMLDGKKKLPPRLAPGEDPIPEDIYPVIDTDLARDNLENDIPAADLEDL